LKREHDRHKREDRMYFVRGRGSQKKKKPGDGYRSDLRSETGQTPFKRKWCGEGGQRVGGREKTKPRGVRIRSWGIECEVVRRGALCEAE